jgi:hypothetical protein
MNLRTMLLNGSSAVWLVLSAATAISWWLGAGRAATSGETASDPTRATVFIMVLAFFKVRLVVQHFMEVRHAPLVLRAITDVWALLACGAVIGLYLWA